MTMTPTRTVKISLAAVVALLLVAGCTNNDGQLTVDNAWGRPSPAAAANGAFYMTISGGPEDDTLVSAHSDVCGTTEIHETTMTDGSMSMQPLPDGLLIPAAATVVLEPGGVHVMCLDVGDALVVGDTLDLELTFAEAGAKTVTVEIHDGSDDMGDMGDMETTTSAG